MKRTASALIGIATMAGVASARGEDGSSVTIYDDGIKLHGERERLLPAGAFGDGPIELVALPGETLGLQVVVDAEGKLTGVHAEAVPVGGASLPIRLESFAEHFVRIPRPSGNEHEPGSLAFAPEAAPLPDAFTGLIADALLPRPLDVDAGHRGALWIDLSVHEDAAAGVVELDLLVPSQQRVLAKRRVRLTIGTNKLPFAATRVAVFYDPVTFDKRMGGRVAEPSLRQLLHAHHLSALPERRAPEEIDLDLSALTGALYTEAKGYTGPGAGIGEGVFAIGAYGSLGDPAEGKVGVIERFIERIKDAGALPKTDVFLYAVDENCKSPRAAQWLSLLERSRVKDKLRVGVTCYEPPAKQAATLVMMPASKYDPGAADDGRKKGKSVWAYNGMRPHSGAMMLDVPATDLRANAWIAMRYGVDGWFYWESSFWLDSNRGGRGGANGFDPFTVAETFHNQDGDYAMQDGILVYPGTQRAPGMTNFGEDRFYASVRLKNLRRGVLDAGYIALARMKDRAGAEAIVRKRVPVAVARAVGRPSWSDDAESWRAARAELFRIVEGAMVDQRPTEPPPESTESSAPTLSARLMRWLGLGVVVGAILLVLRWLRQDRSQ